MTKQTNAELARAINRQAHMLAAQSFASIRMALEEQARAMLKAGKTTDQTLQAIRAAGLQPEASEPQQNAPAGARASG